MGALRRTGGPSPQPVGGLPPPNSDTARASAPSFFFIGRKDGSEHASVPRGRAGQAAPPEQAAQVCQSRPGGAVARAAPAPERRIGGGTAVVIVVRAAVS